MSRIPPRPVIGVLHPGVMGAALGSALKPVAGAVVWSAAGRSDATSKRAETADLIGVPDVAAVARRADVILSICPPHAALDVATEVARAAAGQAQPPLYVDANAVSPAVVAAIGELFGIEHVVDGCVIGPPAWERGTTVLWLAGAAAPDVAALFDRSPFDTRVLGPDPGAASALKACFGLHSKVVNAVWPVLAAAADAYGVGPQVRAELLRSGFDLDAAVARFADVAPGKAWRLHGEMELAGDTFAAVDLPDGFSRAAAQVYRSVTPRTTRPPG